MWLPYAYFSSVGLQSGLTKVVEGIDSYACLKVKCNGLSLIFVIVIICYECLFWRFILFLLKLSLDTPFHVGSTENTVIEPGINQ